MHGIFNQCKSGGRVMDNKFKTARGHTVLFHGAICAYTIVVEKTPRKVMGTYDTTYVDVHLHSGTVFTIQPEDVERFLEWMKR
tara:strand:- start:292 stop:540 length:249 start_codon:yes stop_codon:yes gene_type:complete